MTPETYSELLKDLQKREKTLVPAYLAALRADPALTERFQARFTAAEIGGRFDDFAMLCCRRSAVQFLLRTVYVRVLEDLGALEQPRIRGDWGFAAFREVAPALGVREFLKYTFRDLAHDLPALFTPSAEELPLPSEDLCRETWDLWHRLDGDRPVYAWTSDTFESRFLGELYQDLDAEVRKRFALLQTPPFVEKYILDHTLTPALVEFDPAKLRAAGDAFRLIDPTCGSGHFLIGAFHRLWVYWQAHGVPDPWEASNLALESVFGCDINPHAVDIARFRLMLEVRARTGVTQFDRLASMTLNLRVMDSLIPWERGMSDQGELFPAMDRLSKYATPGERLANGSFLARKFHVVVGNPPYIAPQDPKKREDYRLFWKDSANGKYALSAPFVERVIILGCAGAFTGQITANTFMRRVFGKHLIETVLKKWDITEVIDSSFVRLPAHGTSTVIMFIRTRPPQKPYVWAILGKRGDKSRGANPADSPVWQAISTAPLAPSDNNPYVTVAHVPREVLARYPWSLGGGETASILGMIIDASTPLHKIGAKLGNLTTMVQDEIYIDPPPSVRLDLSCPKIWLIEGNFVRDWGIRPPHEVIYPYKWGELEVLDLSRDTPTYQHMWMYREHLWRRRSRGSKFASLRAVKDAKFYEYPFYTPGSITGLSIVFPEVSTHGHFALSQGGSIFKQTAPAVKLKDGTEDNYLDLLGFFNTSAFDFWTRQTFQPKGGDKKADGARTSSEEWSDRIQKDSTKFKNAPVLKRDRDERVELARFMNAAAIDRSACSPVSILKSNRWTESSLLGDLESARQRFLAITHMMVAVQEELDWLAYSSLGIISKEESLFRATHVEPISPGHRPFEILLAQEEGDVDDGPPEESERSAWWTRNKHERVDSVPTAYSGQTKAVLERRISLIQENPPLAALERPAYKRRWQIPDHADEARDAAEAWLLDRLEGVFRPGGALEKPDAYRLEAIVDAWSRDSRVRAVAKVWVQSLEPDLALVTERLLRKHALPDNPFRVFSSAGSRKLEQWREFWVLQDREDAGCPPVNAAGVHLHSLDLPGNFDEGDFASPEAFSSRGKLNVPREVFVMFADLSPVRYGWNGWRNAQRALAQIAAYEMAERDAENPLPPPTTADSRRCGPTLGLWDSLPDVKRWGDEATHAEFLSLAQEVCSQKACPCTVLESWQEQQARAKRSGRKGSLLVLQSTPKPAPSSEPTPAAATVEDRGLVFRDLLLFGDGGATLAELASKWTREPEHLTRVLDDLIASGDLKTRGRGRKKTYIATAVPGAKET